MQKTKNKNKFNRQSDDDKSDEKIFYIKHFCSGLAFKYIYNSLKPFI